VTNVKNYIVPVFVLLTAFIFVPFLKESFTAPKVICGSLILVYFTVVFGVEKAKFSVFRFPAVIIIIYTAFVLIVSGKSVFLGGNFLALTAVLLILLISSGINKNEKETEMLKKALIFSVFSVSVYAIAQYFGVIGELEKFKGKTPLPYAPFGNRTFLADYVILAFPFCLSMIEENRKKFSFFIAFAPLAAVLLSKSLRAFPALLVIAVIYSFFSGDRMRKIYIFSAAVIMSAGICVLLSGNQKIYRNNIKPRFLMWKAAFDMFKDSPVTGQGFGVFEYEYPSFQGRFFQNKKNLERFGQMAQNPQRANNEYLHVLAESGITGFAVMAWLFVAWFNRVDKGDRCFGLPAFAGVAALMVSALFGFPFHRPETVFTAVLIMGYSVKPVSKNFSKKNLLINGTAVFLCVFFISIKLMEQFHWEKAEGAFEKENYKQAEIESKKALRFSLVPGRFYFLLGRTYYRTGFFNRAIDSYTESLSSYRHRAVYFNRGLAYLKTGRIGEAVHDLETSFYITPNFKPAVSMLKDILTQIQKKGRLARSHENLLKDLK